MLDDLIANWLPYSFAFLMGLSMLIYAVLDGYDLGVGVLFPLANHHEKDIMISSIGPFWDANETWLVLGVGLLLVAFPAAHGVILTHLYLPVAVMLAGLMLRGVSFDFRAKVAPEYKRRWNRAFCFGSGLTAWAQGFMLGHYILGFDAAPQSYAFAFFVGLCVMAGYGLIGAAWLIIKTEGELQRHAVQWARVCLWLTVIGIGVVSLTTPLVSTRIFDKWFEWPAIAYLLPIPVITALLIIWLELTLRRLPAINDKGSWVPFVQVVGIYVLCFLGLAYSFFPYIVPEKMLITEAASAKESLIIIFIGAVAVLPVLIGYTIFAYRVFGGKARELTYN
jgi:cytochrome d ubiquinol oxidase subunit II